MSFSEESTVTNITEGDRGDVPSGSTTRSAERAERVEDIPIDNRDIVLDDEQDRILETQFGIDLEGPGDPLTDVFAEGSRSSNQDVDSGDTLCPNGYFDVALFSYRAGVCHNNPPYIPDHAVIQHTVGIAYDPIEIGDSVDYPNDEVEVEFYYSYIDVDLMFVIFRIIDYDSEVDDAYVVVYIATGELDYLYNSIHEGISVGMENLQAALVSDMERRERLENFEDEELFPQGPFDMVVDPFKDAVGAIQKTHGDMNDAITDIRACSDKINTIADDVQHHLDCFKAFASPTDDVEIWEGLLSRAEDFFLCLLSVKCARNVGSLTCALLTYAKTFVKGSLTRLLADKIKEVISMIFEAGRITEDLKSEGEPGELADFVGFLNSNWQSIRASHLLKNINNALTVIMAVCYSGEEDIIRRLNNLTGGLFTIKCWDFSRGSVGLIDMALNSLHFFLSKGTAILNGASINCILYSDSYIDSLEEEYSRVVSWHKLIDRNELDSISGHTNGEFKTREAYCTKIAEIKKQYVEYRSRETDLRVKQSIGQKILKLDQMISDITMLQKKQSFIKRPISHMIFGGSGVGKTLVRIVLYKATCAGLDVEDSSDFLCIPNEKEVNFDSEYDPNKHHSMLVDDLCNTRYEWYKDSPLDRILRVNNNTPTAVLKAEASEKGLYQYNLRALYSTTNVKDVGSAVFSNNAASIMRRFDYVTTVVLRDEYKNDEGTFSNEEGELYPDAWEFIVQKIRVIRRGTAGDDTYAFDDVLRTHDLTEYSAFMGAVANKHKHIQEKACENAHKIDKEPFCRHYKPKSRCSECKDGSESDTEACNNGMAQEGKYEKPIQYWLPAGATQDERGRIYRKEKEEKADFGSIWKSHFGTCARLAEMSLVQLAGLAMHTYAAHVGVAVMGVMAIRKYLKASNLLTGQSTPSPPTPVAMEQANEWSKKKINRVPIPLKRTVQSMSTTADNLIGCMQRAIFAGKLVRDVPNSEAKQVSNFNLVPLKGVYWLTTSHSVKPGTLYMANVESDTLGISCAEQKIGESDISRIPGTDLAVIRIMAVSCKREYLKFFPLEAVKTTSARTTCITRVRRDWLPKDFKRDTILDSLGDRIQTGGILIEKANLGGFETVNVQDKRYEGYRYKHSVSTFNGMCGSPYIMHTRGTVIMGVHAAGSGQTGFCHAVSKGELEVAIDNLKKTAEVMTAGSIESPQYDYEFDQESLVQEGIKEDDIPNDHCTKWIPEEEPSCIEIFGPHDKGRRSLRSNVKETFISKDVTKIMGIKKLHGKPRGISTWRPWQSNFMEVIRPRNLLDPEILEDAKRSLTKYMLSSIEDVNGKEFVHVWDMHSCINGVDRVSGADRICVSTSAGIPVCGPKHKLSEGYALVDDTGTILELRFCPEVERLVNTIINQARRGERIFTIHQAHIKDEATKLTKDKLRVFAGTQLAFLIVCKMYLGGLNRLFQNFWSKFECCISANCYNSDWSELYRSIFDHKDKEDRAVAGDYKHWDKSMTPQLTMQTAEVVLNICKNCGYDDDDLCVVNALYTEFAYPIYEWDGVYLQAYGTLPSGVFATVMTSNFNNSMLFRYTYMKCAPPEEYWNYDRYIKANFMGDDNLASVDPQCTWWDMLQHAAHLGEAGIQYTSADKESELTPFVHVRDLTYLKRKFDWSEDVEEYMAPLDPSSIAKSLHNYTKRKGCLEPEEVIVGSSIDSAVREYFRHGREVYEMRIKQLQAIIDLHKLAPYVSLAHKGELPSYDDMVGFYLHGEPDRNVPDEAMCFEGTINHAHLLSMNNFNKEESTVITSQEGIQEKSRSHESEGIDTALSHEGISDMLGVNSAKASKNDKQSVIKFEDATQSTGYYLDANMDRTATLQDQPDDALGDFFARPVKIFEDVVPLNVDFLTGFDPWTLFFANIRNINRISNFHLLRCKMHVRILINGNPFYYGRILASYLPRESQDQMEGPAINGDFNQIVLRSQRPHLYLDPTTSQGGEMHLPFFHDGSNINITDGDWDKMGRITVQSIVPLRHANGGTESINFSVFAYATDVRLSVPTSTEPGSLSPQGEYETVMQPEADEVTVTTGKVSAPASAIARGLATIGAAMPTIAPYAMAGSMVADTVSGVARMFGWSRPKLTSVTPGRSKIEIGGNMANVDVGEQVYSLAMDSKNEVSIDPRVVGMPPVDEMSIAHIVSHETMYHKTTWQTSDNAEYSLAQIRVDPYLVRVSGSSYYLTSTAYASLPFNYWTGSLTFRIQVVCSTFHKGRLRIAYDPSWFKTVEYNVNFSKVIDITETRDFTFTIPVCQDRPFVHRLSNSESSYMYADRGTSLTPLSNGNGVIGIFVVNELTAPSSTSDPVTLLISVSGGEDFEVAQPRETLSGISLAAEGEFEVLLPEGTEELVDADGAAAPFTDGEEDINQASESQDLTKVFFGETIKSFRALAKRYFAFRAYGTTVNPGNITMQSVQHDVFPFNRGKVVNAVDMDGVGDPTNYTLSTMLNYLSFAYVGWRGSIRWKIVPLSAQGNDVFIDVARVPNWPKYYYNVDTYKPDLGSLTEAQIIAQNAYNLEGKMLEGTAGRNMAGFTGQAVAEIEMPYYTNRRFQHCRLEDRTSTTFAVGADEDGIKYQMIMHAPMRTMALVAGGDDFMTTFYIGPPVLYFTDLTAPPLPP